jgi:hypothetical protein
MGSTTMAEIRRPIHLLVLIGASTAAYAFSLAGVTALQSSTDRALIDAEAPAADAVERIGRGHDRLESDLSAAAARYAESAARYEALVTSMATMESSLEAYAGRAASVSGAARSLPSHVSLPTVTRTVTTTVVKPRVRATTGASGK